MAVSHFSNYQKDLSFGKKLDDVQLAASKRLMVLLDACLLIPIRIESLLEGYGLSFPVQW